MKAPARTVRQATFPWQGLGLLVVLPFLVVAHSLPHLPGARAETPFDVVHGMASRGKAYLLGNDVPYPVHVDEHFHIARFAQIERTGDVRIDDPYTGEPEAGSLFSVSGMRSERGWQVAMVQFHQLTGVSFPTMAHFLPALWAGYLGLCMWALLRPAPGALAAAAFTVILPTTLRFLGVGFLVPSAFALPWILAVIAVCAWGRGGGRLVALASLITGGFFMHLVPGTVALVAGLVTAVLRPGTWLQRAGLVGAILLPLVWIAPAIAADAEAAVASEHDLPFVATVFLGAGTIVLLLAVAGAAWAFLRPGPESVAPRVFLVLALLACVSLAWSIAADHRNEATYSRLVPAFFLCLAGLAGTGVGMGLALLRRIPVRPALAVPVAACGIVVAGLLSGAALLPPLQLHFVEPYYRVFDDRAWAAATAFEASEAGPDDVFLSHPWRAPVLNALTGAKPWTALLPGGPPERGGDFEFYVASGGADAAWFKERGITYVVVPLEPNAPHVEVAVGVYRIL
ncbi:MAG: hypothetical protein ACYC2H_06390 [Thermoplasmatota archaeon]